MCKAPSLCARCGLAPEDELHRVWACPAAEAALPGDLAAKTSRFKNRALTGEVPCFFLKGIVPRDWVTIPPPPDSHAVSRIGNFRLGEKVRVFRWLRWGAYKGPKAS